MQIERVLTILREKGAKIVLDAGCGDGRFVLDARAAGFDVTGIDVSARALRFAKAYSPDAEFVEGDVAEMPFRKSSFDAVVCMHVLEHIVPEKAPRVVAEIARVLKPGGTLILAVPSARTKVSPNHYRHFAADEVQRTLAPAFENMTVEGFDAASWFLRVPFYFLSLMVLIAYPFRNAAPRFAGWLADVQWTYFKRFLANVPPASARMLVVVAAKPRRDSA
jgi:ubiquinone/menaquinone biosynthesis C-methylase UbiE